MLLVRPHRISKSMRGVRSWLLIYKLGLAKMPNHEYT